ncbi:MAG: hypothetical protein FH756_19555 [Firmicutes bacterium]|nr:hypothetical protein [Bacillota bacterium]
MEALDKIEARLREMRELAEYASDNDLGPAETQEINDKLQAMQKEVTELDDKTRVFWKDCQ